MDKLKSSNICWDNVEKTRSTNYQLYHILCSYTLKLEMFRKSKYIVKFVYQNIWTIFDLRNQDIFHLLETLVVYPLTMSRNLFWREEGNRGKMP